MKFGILCETYEDSLSFLKLNSNFNESDLFHWRSDDELCEITEACIACGHQVVLVNNVQHLLHKPDQWKQLDFVLNLSVGFIDPYRLAASASLLEQMNIPYSGGNPYARMLSQHKFTQKALWQSLGIKCPKGVLVRRGDSYQAYLNYPLFVKPAYEGSSIGVNEKAKVNNFQELNEQIKYIHDYLKMDVLVEEFIEGGELKFCGIGNDEFELWSLIEDVKEDESALGSDYLYFGVKKDAVHKKIKRPLEHFPSLWKNMNMILQHYAPVDYFSCDIRYNQNREFFIIEAQADASLHPMRTMAESMKLYDIDYKKMIETIIKVSQKRWGLI